MNNVLQMSQEKTKGKIEYLDLDLIQTSPDCQPREAINEEIACEYAVAMTEGDEFPPIVVFFDGKTNWLADGYHRYFAARTAKEAEIKANVQHGSKRDAVLYSCGANAKHGIRRTNEDKKRAVATLLKDEEWVNWSDNEIAKKCAVSHPFVGQLRKVYTCNITSMDRTFIHPKTGEPATMQTENIGKGYDPREEIPFLEETQESRAKGQERFKGTMEDAFVTVAMFSRGAPEEAVKKASDDQKVKLMESISKVMRLCELLKKEIVQ